MAHKDEKGNIYGRGAQDMKCVGIQYLEAIRRFIKEKLIFDRTIHVSFTPGINSLVVTQGENNYIWYWCLLDEEIGGILGMAHFVKTNEFRSLNIGFALDEGLASTNEVLPLFYGERAIWRKLFSVH